MAYNPRSRFQKIVPLMPRWYEPYIKSYTWSPDGRMFAFCAYKQGTGLSSGIGDLYLSDCRTGHTWRITDDARGYRWMLFSPDGRWLTYHREEQRLPSVDVYSGDQWMSQWALDTRTRKTYRLLRSLYSRLPRASWVGEGESLAVGNSLYRFDGHNWNGMRIQMKDASVWAYRIEGRLILRADPRGSLPAEREYYLLLKRDDDFAHPATWRPLGTFLLPERFDFGVVSPDGTSILLRYRTTGMTNLLVLDTRARTIRSLGPTTGRGIDPKARWSRDGHFALAGTQPGANAPYLDRVVAYRVADAPAIPLDKVDWLHLGQVTPHVLWKMRPGEGAPEFWVEEDPATARPPSKQRQGKK